MLAIRFPSSSSASKQPGSCLLRLAALLVLAAQPRHAVGQINIESLRGGEPALGTSASFELDVALLSGNVDLKRVALDGRGDYVGRWMAAFLVLQSDIGWKDGRRFQNEALAHLRFAKPTHDRMWLEAFTQVEFDKQRRLSSRFLVGGGARLQILGHTKGGIWWGTAYMLEHERLEPLAEGVPDPATTVYRWSNYVTARLDLREGATATGTTYVQPRLGDLGDVRSLGEVRLSASLTSSWSLETSYRMRYDNQPPLETRSLDSELRSGLMLRF